MKEIFAAYSIIVFVDAIHKLLEICFPVSLLLVKNGNGQSEVVALFLLLKVNEPSITSILNFIRIMNNRSQFLLCQVRT